MMFNSSFVYVNKKLNSFRQHQNRASITGYQQGETQLEDLRITCFLLKMLSANIFFRMYIGGYHFRNFSKETKYLDRETKHKIFAQYKKVFPNVLFCACYFFLRKVSEKMSLKSVLRKFIPPKIRFLRRVIRNGLFIKYCAESGRFRRDSKLRPADLPRYFSIVAIVKNETPYIAEWIEYHLLAGARRFFIYDNESTDNLRELLEPYIRDGIVEYIFFPGKRRQVAAYNDAIRRFKYESFWLAFIDIDEFLVPVEQETVPQFLRDFEDVPGIEINQVLYGSGGLRHKTEGLVMERFKSHSRLDAEINRGAKSIVNPRYVFYMATPHEAEYFDGNCGVDIHKKKNGVASVDRPALHDKIRINHYGVKSFDEFAARIALGKVYYLLNKGPVEDKFSIDEFYARDLNDIQNDPIMDTYIPLVKERLKQRKAR
jgi:hypothetical protein